LKPPAAICALALIATPALAGGGWTQPPGWPVNSQGWPVNAPQAHTEPYVAPPLPPQPAPAPLSIIFGGTWYRGSNNNPSGITKLLPGAKLNKQGWLDAHWGHFDPPAVFDPLEHPYTGDLTIIKTSMQHVKEICPVFQPGIPPLACATHDPGWCRITIARDEDIKAVGWDPNRVLRHELAHCNGWPGDHPGAR
jgi:hypothetical protein